MKKKSKAKKKQIKRQLRLKGINPAVKPTEQDVKIAQNLAAGMKKGEALIAAGISPENARSNSAEIIGRPGVRAALALALDEAGVGLTRIAQVLNEGLSATKIISANLLVTDENGKEELPCTNGFVDATAESAAKEFIRVEDFSVRHKYLETSCKLLDLFPREAAPGSPDLPPDEEMNLIKQAEAAVGQRDISRYTVIRERQTV